MEHASGSTAVVSLLGRWPLRSFEWLNECVGSFSNIMGVNKIFFVWDEDFDVPSFVDIGPSKYQVASRLHEKIDDYLMRYPNIKKVRSSDLTWRKIIDVTLSAIEFDSILLVDTDVMIRRRVELPRVQGNFIIYPCEDIPAYRADFRSVFTVPLVCSANAGFVYYSPSVIDFDFLEWLCKKYIVGLKNFWWSEQFAWSALAARADKHCLWSGDSVRVVSGQGTRSVDDLRHNKVKWLSRKIPIKSGDEMLALCEDTPIIHMSGYGKKYFHSIRPGNEGASTRDVLDFYDDVAIGMFGKCMLGSRLLSLQLKDLVKG